ncbi:MAG TPA: hypothetical protein DEF45_13930 [Rhodopirellula sp.]|nr:hypothetical protein [Rhodopirellula sp.]
MSGWILLSVGCAVTKFGWCLFVSQFCQIEYLTQLCRSVSASGKDSGQQGEKSFNDSNVGLLQRGKTIKNVDFGHWFT